MEPRYEPNEDKLRDQSPDEAKRTVKEKVSRVVATVAGALEGFTQQMRKNDVPEQTKAAVEQVGETTRKISEATRRESRQIKQTVGGTSDAPLTGTAHREPGTESDPDPTFGTGRRKGDELTTSDELSRR